MNPLLHLAFLFFIGSCGGWVLELFYRRFAKHNKDRKWINPGFCTGPYLPLYGMGLCILYLLASIKLPFASDWANHTLLILLIAVSMTAIEYICGIVSLECYHVRLWDYRNNWGNIQGIICPQFSAIWAIMGIAYCYIAHPYVCKALDWLSDNLAFSFVIGLFFGVFIVDLANSIQLIARLRRFANEHQVILRYETIKYNIRRSAETAKIKYSFFHPFHTERPLREHLIETLSTFEQRIKDVRPSNKFRNR